MAAPNNVQTIWTDKEGNRFHVHADHRPPMMRDYPNAFNPLTGQRYVPVPFAGLSRAAQRRRLAAWNAALDQRLVEYDERYGLPPANNADAAAAAAAAP